MLCLYFYLFALGYICFNDLDFGLVFVLNRFDMKHIDFTFSL